MSTVIAFPVSRRKGTGKSAGETARLRPDAGPVVVILPVVRIERHETAPDAPMDDPVFGTGPGSRRAR